MQQLTGFLLNATAQIKPAYFQIELDGGDPVYRERVYCYELYHQIRCQWPTDTPFYLNGELDKMAHPILRTLGADYAKPDLLVHCPGDMGSNNTVIEVKSAKAQRREIRKDLKTLAIFRTEVNYRRAIYLIFGFEALTTADRVRQVAKKMGALPPIELWIHTKPGEAAQIIHGDISSAQ